MRLSFCKLEENEIEQVMYLWEEVFNYSKEQLRIIHDVSVAGMKSGVSEISGIRSENGKLIGALRNDYRWIKIGKGKVFVSDIGYVSIKPEFQGKGYGTYLMEENMKCLKDKGVHIARLGGLVKFYEKFGFSRIPSFWYAFPLEEIKAGNKRIPITDVLKIEQAGIKIREFDKFQDFGCYKEITETDGKVRKVIDDNQEKFIIERKYEPELKRYIFEYKNTPVGFLFSYNNVIYDYGFKNGEEFVNLLKWFLYEKYNEQYKESRISHLFYDDILERKLIDGNVTFEKVERNSSISSDMICIVSFNSIIRFLMPEFQNVKKEMEIKIVLTDKNPAEEVKLVAAPDNNCIKIDLKMRQSEFIKFLFGIPSHLYANYNKEILEQIFPKKRCGFFI